MTLRDHAPQQIAMNYPQHAAAHRYRRRVKSGQAEEPDARYHDAKPEASGSRGSAGEKGLTVLIATREPNGGGRLEKEAAALIRAPALRVDYRRIPGVDVPGLARAVKREGGGVLVLSGALVGEEATGQLLTEVENPVLLVGEARQ